MLFTGYLKQISMTKGVSVIVCCYNSALKLPQTIGHLANQVVPSEIFWEIILVDNASTDNTAAAAVAEWAKYDVRKVSFKVAYQPKAGLSYAREMGINESKYDILIFCDDDNLLCNTYIHDSYDILSSNQELGAVGGFGKSFYELPTWLKDFEEYYALGPQGVNGDITSSRGCLYGAGLVIKRNCLTLLIDKQFKSLTTDRKGNSLSSGGDTELTFAIRILGYKLFYDSRLQFVHVIDRNRFSFRYFNRLMFNIGYSWAVLMPYHIHLNKIKKHYPRPDLKDVFYSFIALIRSLAGMLIQAFMFNLARFKKCYFIFVFKSGEFWFIISRYRHYRIVPPFLSDLS